MISNKNAKNITKSQLMDVYTIYKGIEDSYNFINRKRVSRICSKPILAFVHWVIANEVDESSANGFIDGIILGENLPPKNPVLYARTRIQEMKSSKSSDVNGKIELLFWAWNAHRRWKELSHMRIGGGKLPILEK